LVGIRRATLGTAHVAVDARGHGSRRAHDIAGFGCASNDVLSARIAVVAGWAIAVAGLAWIERAIPTIDSVIGRDVVGAVIGRGVVGAVICGVI